MSRSVYKNTFSFYIYIYNILSFLLFFLCFIDNNLLLFKMIDMNDRVRVRDAPIYRPIFAIIVQY